MHRGDQWSIHTHAHTHTSIHTYRHVTMHMSTHTQTFWHIRALMQVSICYWAQVQADLGTLSACNSRKQCSIAGSGSAHQRTCTQNPQQNLNSPLYYLCHSVISKHFQTNIYYMKRFYSDTRLNILSSLNSGCWQDSFGSCFLCRCLSINQNVFWFTYWSWTFNTIKYNCNYHTFAHGSEEKWSGAKYQHNFFKLKLKQVEQK